MATSYVTFGQIHAHRVNGETFDRDCVASIECKNAAEGEALANQLFGLQYCFLYHEAEFNWESLIHFPRGIIKAN